MSAHLVDIVIIGSVAACALPIVAAWLLLLRARRLDAPRFETVAILGLLTLSYACLWVGYFWPWAVAGGTNTRKFAIILSNLGIDAMLALWSFVRRPWSCWLLVCCACLTAICWLYVLAVNSVV